MSHAKCEIFARLRASWFMARARGAHIRIQRAKLYRFMLQMVGFVVIRGVAKFACMSRIWAGLVPYFHEFLALRALSGRDPGIVYDS